MLTWWKNLRRISYAEITYAIKAMKTGKATGLSEANAEMVAECGQVEKEMMRELCQKIFLMKRYDI